MHTLNGPAHLLFETQRMMTEDLLVEFNHAK